MHVGWFAHRDAGHPLAGGAEKSITAICTVLAERGHRITVVCPRGQGESSTASIDGVDYLRVSSDAITHLRAPFMIHSVIRPDIIVDDLAHVVPWFGNWVTDVPVVPFFRHLHARTLPGQVGPAKRAVLMMMERLYPIVYPNSTFVVPSRSAMSDLESLGIPRNRTRLIGYGVDRSLFAPRDQDSSPTIVHFSGLRRYKRPDHALRVLSVLLEWGVKAKLTLVGGTEELSDMRGLISKLGIESFVDFPGHLSENELSNLVGRSWVHIQCSISEGWGLSVTEATASGVPTAAYSVPGLIDSVHPGANGLLVPDGDITALAVAVRDMLQHKHEWRQKCLSDSSTRTWSEVGLEWEQTLGELIRNRNRDRSS